MADKSIEQLAAAEQVYASDLFVLQQSGAAKKLTGQTLENWLLKIADGHGGIQSIVPVGKTGLVTTFRITLADLTTVDFQVTDGRGISDAKKIKSEGLVDTWRFTMSDDTYVDIPVTNGAKGDKGDNAYTWIKYASQQPTAASHTMGDIPDAWMGIYTGTLAAAPTDWTQYKWYRVRGDQGVTGTPATLTGRSVTYMASDSGTVIPSGSWSSEVPTVGQGRYLWTRVVLTFNSGSPVTYYSVSRMGLDGSGAVSTVNGKDPDATGNVKLTGEDITGSSGSSIAAELDDKATKTELDDKAALLLPLAGGTMTGNIDLGGNALTNVKAPAAATDGATKGYVDGKRFVLTTTIPVNWTGSAEPYAQTISVPGILATDTLHIMPVYTDPNYSVTLAQIEGWSNIVSAFSGDGAIAFYCRPDKPTVAIPIQIEVMR